MHNLHVILLLSTSDQGHFWSQFSCNVRLRADFFVIAKQCRDLGRLCWVNNPTESSHFLILLAGGKKINGFFFLWPVTLSHFDSFGNFLDIWLVVIISTYQWNRVLILNKLTIGCEMSYVQWNSLFWLHIHSITLPTYKLNRLVFISNSCAPADPYTENGWGQIFVFCDNNTRAHPRQNTDLLCWYFVCKDQFSRKVNKINGLQSLTKWVCCLECIFFQKIFENFPSWKCSSILINTSFK